MGSAPSRKTRRRGRAPMAEINVTPMVDVMLVLLIIFMVTAPLLKAGVPLELPDSKAKALGDDANQITISLSRGGALFLDNAEVLPGELAVRLATFERDDKGRLPPITLRADKGLDYGRVMAVMGEINRAGFTQIALVTTAAAVSDGSGSGD